mgnify:FL=1
MEGRFEKQLLQCKSLDEFVTMFFGLSKQQQMSVLGDEIRIPKGTRLYRARKYEGIPLTHENDWWLPPADKVKKGRFNYPKKPVLYVSTTDFILPREIGLNVNEKYYLAKYECKEDIRVGSLLKSHNRITCLLHKMAMAVESAEKLTENEKMELQKCKCEDGSISNFIGDLNSVFYIYKYLHRDLYDITNKIADLLLQKYPEGFRYCSCYASIEASGGSSVVTLAGELVANYALTEAGAKKLKLIDTAERLYTEEEYKNNDRKMFISANLEVYNEGYKLKN